MSEAARTKIIVLGVGNPDRGDDAAGALVAARLAGRLPPETALIVRSGDILGVMEDWAGHDALVCVDAAVPMGTPGRIHRFDAASAELAQVRSLTSGHAFGLAETIALAREMRALPETVVVYAVEGVCFDGGAPMTPEVAAAIGEVAERIIEEVGRINQSGRTGAPRI